MNTELYHEIIDAFLLGQEIVEFRYKKSKNKTWYVIPKDSKSITLDADFEYRIGGKRQILSVPDEFWKIINPKYKWLALDIDGCLYAFGSRPEIYSNEAGWSPTSPYWIKIDDFLDIEIDDVIWSSSLTPRPQNI